MIDSEEVNAACTSIDNKEDLESILAYHKEPEYTEEEIAAGIADIHVQVDADQAAASLESEGHWPPESRVGNTN